MFAENGEIQTPNLQVRSLKCYSVTPRSQNRKNQGGSGKKVMSPQPSPLKTGLMTFAISGLSKFLTN